MNKQMSGKELRQKYLDFFVSKGHRVIPAAPLVLMEDPTTLFTSSGMQPLVPYLLGQEHPEGTRVVDSQPSFRTQDIEEVGDNRHTTFFEMLGNWSLGDYFKKEQLRWKWEFLTKELGLDPKQLYVSVFSGDEENNLPKDEESILIWKEVFKESGMEAEYVELGSEENGATLGMQDGRIFGYEAKKNWWSRAGVPGNMPAGEPGGGDSEIFYEFVDVEHDPTFGENCHPNCDCGRFMEIGNSVFMEYVKQEDGSFEKLPKQNVDFGGGLERILAAVNDTPDVFRTDLFTPIIAEIEAVTGKSYVGNEQAMRVIADHMRAATMMIGQGLVPGNKAQGYFLRRLLRRSAVKMRELLGKDTEPVEYQRLVKAVMGIYEGVYFHKEVDLEKENDVLQVVYEEIVKFNRTLERGMKELEKYEANEVTGEVAFDLFQTYGFPYEITEELVEAKGGTLNRDAFERAMIRHQDTSRTASAGMFKGGLADNSENVVKYHTATHLLHAALRKVLGEHVQQKGSNITGERMRFDFAHPQAMTKEEIKDVEDWMNEQIENDLVVIRTVQGYEEALNEGALAFFGEKYPDQVSVYTIGEADNWVSKELCGGPHVEHTGEIGKVKITKEKSASAGVRRVYVEMG